MNPPAPHTSTGSSDGVVEISGENCGASEPVSVTFDDNEVASVTTDTDGTFATSFDVPDSLVGTMATVPLPEAAGSTAAEALALRDALLFEDQIEVQMHAFRGRVWARISAQIYNDMEDIDRLAAAVARRVAVGLAG